MGHFQGLRRRELVDSPVGNLARREPADIAVVVVADDTLVLAVVGTEDNLALVAVDTGHFEGMAAGDNLDLDKRVVEAAGDKLVLVVVDTVVPSINLETPLTITCIFTG